MSTGAEYLQDVAKRFAQHKELADRAIAQVPDDGLWVSLDPESNSIGVLVRHLAGNIRSRWRDFLTSDGEKPDRHRDQEFQAPNERSRASLLADWESAWALLFQELAKLTTADLEKSVTARHEPMSVVSAINRQFGHAAQHIGQIILLAKHLQTGAWRTLSIERGQSEAFNEMMRQKFQRSQAE
jgi:hypothetical protein